MTTTFGIAPTPSPAFLGEEVAVDEKVVDLKILACRPADLSAVPAKIAARLNPIQNPLSDFCQSCQCEVHVGPAQVSAYMNSDNTLILCLLCTGVMLIQSDVDCSSMVIRHLGD